uniref:MOSC domain-containing protein n=1 Tax=Caenorhabditis tropicalis TaxID=1561998 RepID=A0A1I7SZ89_9PELO
MWEREGYSQKAIAHCHVLQNPSVAVRCLTKEVELLSTFIAPGVRITDCVSTFQHVAVTRAGEDIIAKGSPEFLLMNHILTKRGRSDSLKNVMKLECGEEGMKVAEDKGWVEVRNGIVITRNCCRKEDNMKGQLRMIQIPG